MAVMLESRSKELHRLAAENERREDVLEDVLEDVVQILQSLSSNLPVSLLIRQARREEERLK